MKYGFHGFFQPFAFLPLHIPKIWLPFSSEIGRLCTSQISQCSAHRQQGRANVWRRFSCREGNFFLPQKILGQMGPPLEMRDFSRKVWGNCEGKKTRNTVSAEGSFRELFLCFPSLAFPKSQTNEIHLHTG